MKCDENLKYTQIIPKSEFLKPVIIGVVVIPISLTLWMFTVLSTHYLTDSSKNCSVEWSAHSSTTRFPQVERIRLILCAGSSQFAYPD